MRAPSWLTTRRLAVMLFGSVAVAAFTWWMLEPRVSARYVISTTMNPHVRPLMYKHLISLDGTSGSADRIELAVTFTRPVRMFNTWLHAPSSAHTLSCDIVPTGTKCRLGPLDAKAEYAMALVTDSGEPPVLTSESGDIRLTSAREDSQTTPLDVLIAALAVASFIVVMHRTRSRRPLPVFRGPHW